jgi:hypothetical protein
MHPFKEQCGFKTRVIQYTPKGRAMEIIYFVGALILLTALIYGTLHTRYRSRAQRKVTDQIVRDRYESNRT